MSHIFLVGVSLFVFSQLVHVLLWRIFSPKAYPIWLPLVFTLAPAACLIALYLWGFGLPSRPIHLMSALVLHSALSGMYIYLYPAIVFFSPSLELLKILREQPGHSLSIESLERMELAIFSEKVTVGMRLEHLQASRMILPDSKRLHLSARGIRVARAFSLFRRAIGLEGIGGG